MPEFGYRTKVEVVVPDAVAKAIVRDILKILGTGASAIGKIFVFDVEEAYDLGSGDTGDTAL